MANLETIGAKEFYEEYLPQRFAEADVQEGGYALLYQVGEVTYTCRVTEDRRLEVISDGLDSPLMAIQISEQDWRDAITGRVAARSLLVEPGRISAQRLQKIRDLRGKLELELSRSDGEPWRVVTIFNGAEAPAVKLQMSAEDYAAIERGELNSQMAFMSGRLKFQGDLGLLMKVGSLLA